MAAPFGKRPAGSGSSARTTSASRAAGTSGRTARGEGAGAADPDGGERGRRVAAPRASTGQRLVQDQAEAVDVGRGGRRRAPRLLRAEVVDRAERRARDGALGVGGQPGDPEVGDHRPAVAGEQDVAGLHVAMDDPADVGDAERAGDVEADPGGLGRFEAAGPPQPRGEVLAFDELHDQERLAVVGAGLEAGDDVRVAEDGRGERLAPEAHRDVGVLDRPRGEGA